MASGAYSRGSSEGESPVDEQSETTGAPVPEESPPRRTPTAPIVLTVSLVLAAALFVALVVAAIRS